MEAAKGAHILVFPYPAPGHIYALLDLTHQLAIRGLSITILVTSKNQPYLKPLLTNHPSIQTLVFPFPSYPHIPEGVENIKDTSKTYSARSIWMGITCALRDLSENIIHWFQTHPSPPIAIISDFFLGWTYHLACDLGIPRYVFSPSGVLAFSILHSLKWGEKLIRKCDNDDNEIISFPNIPNSPNYPWWQISPTYRRCLQNEGEEESRIVSDGFLCNMKSYGVIINSFDKLEEVYVKYLKKEIGHDRVWCIGPLLPPGYGSSGPIQRDESSLTSNVFLKNKISSWLDSCDKSSVLYVCFGSQHVYTKSQMQVLALGLEKSGVKFIWVMNEGKDDVIPIGFEDRVAGTGLLIKEWAPQILILKHPSIGGFLTHCGWNSILESIVAGVPMLAWPMSADQFIDATLLVDNLEVAIRVGEGEKNIPDPIEFANVVAKMMGPTHDEKRLRTIDLRNAALEAICENGSSSRNLDEFILQLSQKPSNDEIS